MLKKIAKLVCLSCVALSGTLSADQTMSGSNGPNGSKPGPEMYDGGFTLGASLNSAAGGTNPFLTLGYIGDMFLFDVGVNFTNYNFDKKGHDNNSKNYGEFMGHFGLRNQLSGNLYFTYGVTGSVVAGDFNDNGRPYSVGAFTGLDFQAMKHFLISVKINPYNYQRPSNDVHYNEVFSSYSVNLAYVF